MGLHLGFSHSCHDTVPVVGRVVVEHTCPQPLRLPNPNPRNFRIVRTESVGAHVVAEIWYPDCTNYEGRKVCVFADCTAELLFGARVLDPHFTNNRAVIAPVARFEPTERGWRLAIACANAI